VNISLSLLSLYGRCKYTKILHILISRQREWAALSLSALLARAVALEDDDAVSCSSGNKRSAVGELSPTAVGVEGDVAQAVTQRAEQEGHVAAEPGELEAAYEIVL
jgi:hypothetical protein